LSIKTDTFIEPDTFGVGLINTNLKNLLSKRIIETLKAYQDKQLLCDIHLQMTGKQILDFQSQLDPTLNQTSRTGGRVGILFTQSTLLAMSILAVIASNRVPVVLNYSAKERSLRSLIPNLKLDTIIIPASEFQNLNFGIPVIEIDPSCHIKIQQDFPRPDDCTLPPEETALILYTSGSNGEPKGVLFSQTGLIYMTDLLIDYYDLDHHSKATCLLPLDHTMGLNTQFLPTFFAGGTCYFYSSTLTVGMLYRKIIETKGTFVAFITDLLQFCYEEKKRKSSLIADSVKHIQLSGGVIRQDHLDMAEEIFPNAVIHKGYGLTEGLRVAMMPDSDPEFLSAAAGYVLSEQTVEIRGSDGNKLDHDQLGLIHINGPNVMIGYDNINDETVQDGFFNTGDLGQLSADNRLTIYGRSDSMFKVKGFRISGREIEDTIQKLQPGFKNVRILPVYCKRRGTLPFLIIEGEVNKLFQFLADDKNDFEQKLKEQLVDDMKVPKNIYMMKHFPRTRTGKIINAALTDLYHQNDRLSDLGSNKAGFHYRLVPSTFFND